MRKLPKLVDRLVAGQMLLALSGAWFVLVGFDAITALAGEMGDLGKGDYGFGQALVYIVYTLPRRAYTLFPTAAVIGALLGLGALASSSELTALRAGGLSRTRICVPVVVVLLLLTGFMMLVAETVGPVGEQYAQRSALAAKSTDVTNTYGSGLWAREGNVFLNAAHGHVVGQGAEATIELRDVTLYEFDQQDRLMAISRVQRAVHQEGGWALHEVHRSRFSERRAEVEMLPVMHWESALNPDVLKLGVVKPRHLPLAELGRSLTYLQRNHLDDAEFAEAWWSRIFYPFSTLALCIAALPFVFGSLRSGGFGKRLFLGIVLGVGMFTAQTLSVNMAQVYHIDLRVAFALPPLLVLLASWGYFRKRI